MRAAEWTALLTAIAGVVVAVAAIPATGYRVAVFVVAALLILLALLIAVVSSRRVRSTFRIASPRPDQVIADGAAGVVISGTVPDLRADTLWVFEEGTIGGRRVWFFGGEALVDGDRWSFDYEPGAGQSDRARRTLSIVRADRNGERLLRSIRPDDAGRLVVYGAVPGGCTVLGQVSMFITARA
jgi:hypothetical protein